MDENDRFAENLLTTVARTVMNQLVGDYSFDEVIGAKRSDIAFKARDDSQRILDAYACGITVTALQMQRVIPPNRVKPAFDKVNASIQEKQKLENEAEATRNKLIPEARANRDKLIREAEGYASRRQAEANGEIEALLAKYHAYERAPEITRQRLYLEAMQDVLQGVKNKTIIDSDLKQLVAASESRCEGRRPAHEPPRSSPFWSGWPSCWPSRWASRCLYTVSERELAVLLQFGEPVASRTQPGLYFKLPLDSGGHAAAQDASGLARDQPR